VLDPFYPVVPDSGWVVRLVAAGTRLIQLRIKDQPAGEIRRQVKQAKAAKTAALQKRLFQVILLLRRLHRG
jgi:thiamine-phosphate pyrophosphorylase